MTSQNFVLNLSRLDRHYQYCFNRYDPVGMADLSHCLRMWVDMVNEVDLYLEHHSLRTPLRTAIPTKKLNRFCSNATHIVAGTPGGVKLPNVVMGDLVYIQAQSTELDKFLNTPNRHFQIKTYSRFSNWIDSNILRVGLKQMDGSVLKLSISRRELIQRLANRFGGSHPIKREKDRSDYDGVLRLVFDFKMGMLPLTHFLMLNIAQDMLERMPLFGKEMDVSTSWEFQSMNAFGQAR